MPDTSRRPRAASGSAHGWAKEQEGGFSTPWSWSSLYTFSFWPRAGPPLLLCKRVTVHPPTPTLVLGAPGGIFASSTAVSSLQLPQGITSWNDGIYVATSNVTRKEEFLTSKTSTSRIHGLPRRFTKELHIRF